MPPVEPIVLLLSALVVLFTFLLFGAEHWFPMDGQIFQVISGLITGFAGALLMRVKPRGTGDDVPAGMQALTMHTETRSTTEAEKKS